MFRQNVFDVQTSFCIQYLPHANDTQIERDREKASRTFKLVQHQFRSDYSTSVSATLIFAKTSARGVIKRLLIVAIRKVGRRPERRKSLIIIFLAVACHTLPLKVFSLIGDGRQPKRLTKLVLHGWQFGSLVGGWVRLISGRKENSKKAKLGPILRQRILTYFIRKSIPVQLTSCFTCLDSAALLITDLLVWSNLIRVVNLTLCKVLS